MTHAGRIVHEPTREAIEGPTEDEAHDEAQDQADRGRCAESADQTEAFEPEPNESEPEREQATQQLDLPFDQEEQK